MKKKKKRMSRKRKIKEKKYNKKLNVYKQKDYFHSTICMFPKYNHIKLLKSHSDLYRKHKLFF